MEGFNMKKKRRYDIKTSRLQGRTVSTKTADIYLFIHLAKFGEEQKKKKKKLGVARGLGEVAAEIRI